MTESLADHDFAQALAGVEKDGSSPIEKIEMLVEVAMRLQQKPKSVADVHHAVALYEQALARCAAAETLLIARIRARKATALSAIVDAGPRYLFEARRELEAALPFLGESGSQEETAEAEMNLGVVIQSLAGLRSASIADAIMAYQRAVRVFTRERYPTEFAILHNNLATAYLSIPISDERSKMREALAVQSFAEALKVVTLIDNPTEYAMLQNNLGNALQYAASGHPLANNLRALEAYDASLAVRNARDTPAEYANTISNKANCLRNLPDDAEYPEAGNGARMRESRTLYREAFVIFERLGATDKAAVVREALEEIAGELGDDGETIASTEADFGESRI